MATRKRYTKEFTLDAIRPVTEHSCSKVEAARSLGINANMPRRWVKEFEDDESQAFHGNGRLTPEQEELRRLRVENRQLKLEREILKKATAFFAKESD